MSARPGLVPRLVIATATRALPRGVSRDRYRREFAAELHELGRTRQLGYALGVLTHIRSLRIVLVKGVDSAHVPLLCRTNIHHHWRGQISDEGASFATCRRCGKEKGPIEGSNIEDFGMAGGWLSGNVM